MRYTISVIFEWLYPRARNIRTTHLCLCNESFAPYRINMNAAEISIVPIESPLHFRDLLHRSVEPWYCTARITSGGMRDTQLHLRFECGHRDRGTASGPDFLSARGKGKEKGKSETSERSFPSSSAVPSDAALFRMLYYDGEKRQGVWQNPHPWRTSKRDVFEQTIESIFLFLSYFLLSLMSLFSQHRSSSGTRSSDSSQIVDGTAMFPACQSAPRNLTPRPCIHRPLFLEANGRIGVRNAISIGYIRSIRLK